MMSCRMTVPAVSCSSQADTELNVVDVAADDEDYPADICYDDDDKDDFDRASAP